MRCLSGAPQDREEASWDAEGSRDTVMVDGKLLLRRSVYRDVEHPDFRTELDWLALCGVIVFVAESQIEGHEMNSQILDDLVKDLGALNRNPRDISIVVASNKSDLPTAKSMEFGERARQFRHLITVDTSAAKQTGIGELAAALYEALWTELDSVTDPPVPA